MLDCEWTPVERCCLKLLAFTGQCVFYLSGLYPSPCVHSSRICSHPVPWPGQMSWLPRVGAACLGAVPPAPLHLYPGGDALGDSGEVSSEVASFREKS